MDRLWTPWRFAYIAEAGAKPAGARDGVAAELAEWPGPDTGCVFCNLIQSVEWGVAHGLGVAAEQAGLVVARLSSCFVCLNAFPYSSGHLLLVPRRHVDSLARLPALEAAELMAVAQQAETVLRQAYTPGGINLGMNLGKAAGAGVADHLHLHVLPRWVGDANFMTVTAETRVLPETLGQTWAKLTSAWAEALAERRETVR